MDVSAVECFYVLHTTVSVLKRGDSVSAQSKTNDRSSRVVRTIGIKRCYFVQSLMSALPPGERLI